MTPDRCTHSFPDPYPQPMTQPGDCRDCGITYQEAKAAMTNPSDELRAAAARLRTLATAATPGPWTVDSSIPYGHRVGSSDEADWIARTGEHGETGSQDDAAYIAAMNPTVGTALAHLLDLEESYLVDMPENEHLAHVKAALAVARAINGGEQR